jgi:hypothetical protein
MGANSTVYVVFVPKPGMVASTTGPLAGGIVVGNGAEDTCRALPTMTVPLFATSSTSSYGFAAPLKYNVPIEVETFVAPFAGNIIAGLGGGLADTFWGQGPVVATVITVENRRIVGELDPAEHAAHTNRRKENAHFILCTSRADLRRLGAHAVDALSAGTRLAAPAAVLRIAGRVDATDRRAAIDVARRTDADAAGAHRTG